MPPQQAVAFVAGATGFVGRALVPALVAAGVRTIAHIRPDSRELPRWRDEFGSGGAEVDTTAWDRDAIAATFTRVGVTHVFNLIGTTRKRARQDTIAGDPYQAIDVGLTNILVSAAARHAARPRFIYLSSVGASGEARSAYLRARARAEALVTDSGLPYRIARPSIISGPGRDDARPTERAAGLIADGLLAVVGAFGARRTRDRYRSTSPDRLAASLARIALDDGGDRVVESEHLG